MHDNVVTFSASSRKKSNRPARRAGEATSDTKIVRFDSAPCVQRITARINSKVAVLPANDVREVRMQQDARRSAWEKARAKEEYLSAALRWLDACWIAESHGIDTGRREKHDLHWVKRRDLAELQREAIGKLLLTPAPDGASVRWKRTRSHRSWSGIPEDLLDTSIAEDLEWLRKYPASQRRVRQRRP